MTENLEIEFKILLSKKLYYKMLLDFTNKTSKRFLQTNYYFETPNKNLKNNKMNLRVRQIENTYELTLKRKNKFSRNEYNANISKEQFELLKQNKTFDHPIFDILKETVPLNQLNYICSLTTERIEVSYGCGLLCFDKNTYFDDIDYELEFEVPNEEIGRKEFLELVESYGLEYKKNCKGKTARAFKTFQQQHDKQKSIIII